MKHTMNNRYSPKGYHESSHTKQFILLGLVVLIIAGTIGICCIMFGVGL